MSDRNDTLRPAEARARAVGHSVYVEHAGDPVAIASWGMPGEWSAQFVAGVLNTLLDGLRAELADAAEKAGRHAHETGEQVRAMEAERDRLRAALHRWMKDHRAGLAVAADCTNADACPCVYCESQRAMW